MENHGLLNSPLSRTDCGSLGIGNPLDTAGVFCCWLFAADMANGGISYCVYGDGKSGQGGGKSPFDEGADKVDCPYTSLPCVWPGKIRITQYGPTAKACPEVTIPAECLVILARVTT